MSLNGWKGASLLCFPDIDLSLKANGTTWIEIGGSTAIKAFLKEEFRAFRGVGRG
jgi:hypothetical protein